MPADEKSVHHEGLFFAIASYATWGVMPLYWVPLRSVPAFETFSNRVIWSCVLLTFVLLYKRKLFFFNDPKYKVPYRPLIISGVLIGVNWCAFIWAVTQGHVLEASLGYFINPIVTIVMGILFFKERLRWSAKVAILLACLAVINLLFFFGKLPWVSLFLAGTFGLYGLMKKKYPYDPLISLFVECILIGPFAMGYLIFLEKTGTTALLHGTSTEQIFLMGAGLTTAVPLLFFQAAAKRIPMSTLGFCQYIAPTLQFLLGIFYFQEPFSTARFASFSLVWAGIVVLLLDTTHKAVKSKRLVRG